MGQTKTSPSILVILGGKDFPLGLQRPQLQVLSTMGPKSRSQNKPSLIGVCVLYSTVSGFSTLPTTTPVDSFRSAHFRICSGEAIPISIHICGTPSFGFPVS